MPKYRVVVTELFEKPDSVADGIPIFPVTDVYSQTLSDLNLSTLIRALNPTTRKRRAKKETTT